MSGVSKHNPFPDGPVELMSEIRRMMNNMRARGAEPGTVVLNAEDYSKVEKFLDEVDKWRMSNGVYEPTPIFDGIPTTIALYGIPCKKGLVTAVLEACEKPASSITIFADMRVDLYREGCAPEGKRGTAEIIEVDTNTGIFKARLLP